MPAAPEIPYPGSPPGHGVKTTWTYTLGSIVFVLLVLDVMLLGLALNAIEEADDAVSWVVLLALLVSVGAQIRYCWFLRAGLGGGLPRPAWTAALLLPAAVVWACDFVSADIPLWRAVPLWLAISLAACLLPRWQKWWLLAAGLAVALIPFCVQVQLFTLNTVPQHQSYVLLLFYSALTPIMVISGLWWWRVVVELDKHRLIAGELAVAQERLRFAADLHDIQGHHLQVIALKSELAERLLSRDPQAARENIHQTRLIAKEALEETRSLVSGYRDVALANELENAREVLTASGAECELLVDGLPSTPEAHRALAMTVRETTTNILRHSNAKRVSIALATTTDGTTLDINNDGVAATAAAGNGTGLLGLRERLEGLGGTLTTAIHTNTFELRAWVPTEGAKP
ncbi:sensor histidine kinase [Specibacter sp. NPDC057265]|uniref:sensor histidine kinase n=1 Tax=Specibacter sp. NPDC057265 TaxID=3346075 RepID=UPI003636A967